MLELTAQECAIVEAGVRSLHADQAEADGVIARVAAMFELEPADLLGRSRHPGPSQARQIACYLLSLRSWTTMEIAGAMQRDHATVTYSVNKIRRSLPLRMLAREVA